MKKHLAKPVTLLFCQTGGQEVVLNQQGRIRFIRSINIKKTSLSQQTISEQTTIIKCRNVMLIYPALGFSDRSAQDS